MTEIPLQPNNKINEWTRKPIVLGTLAGLNAVLWLILVNHWLGLV